MFGYVQNATPRFGTNPEKKNDSPDSQTQTDQGTRRRDFSLARPLGINLQLGFAENRVERP
jgi:hypothetical protein